MTELNKREIITTDDGQKVYKDLEDWGQRQLRQAQVNLRENVGRDQEEARQKGSPDLPNVS